MQENPSGETDDLERVREELRQRGYLSHGFERFLLQDALRPRRPVRALAILAGKVGLRAGLVLSPPLAFWLAAANGALVAHPFDAAVLFLHLFAPIALAAALAFLLVGAATAWVVRFSHVRRIEAFTFGAAAAVGVATLALALWRAEELVAASGAWQIAVLAVAAPFVLFALVKTVHHGLLTLAIRLADEPSEAGSLSRGWLAFLLAAAVLVVLLPALLAARRPAADAPGSLPMAPGGRVLAIGIDGVLGPELDYLLARGELPALGALAQSGAVFSYPRGDEPPASFWTRIATGRPTPEHGVAALDGFRPLGAKTTLMRSGPLRPYWRLIEVPLGLSEHRPLLAGRRSAFAFWELAARGGEPALAVDWWATFPAAPVPGRILAHGGYQLLAERAEGAVAPATDAPALAALARAAALEGPPLELARILSRPALARLDSRALAPDRFYRAAFSAGLSLHPKAAALYLAALDIAADRWPAGSLAFGDRVRAELLAADRLIESARPGFDTVAIVVDPGRRGGAEGRIVLWRAAGCRGNGATRTLESLAPEALASGLMRALGLPQSEELPAPPAVCAWPAPPGRVATYGVPSSSVAAARESGEYLENLRSLGYL
ncbi:MAG TPA: hypothetical protein VGS22_27170 [Thermoanaerobaculia bacterium]|jgi:hypothetical protein|nr:hypothetical protein [Thermoanaerobaculia bacterium]